MSAVRLMVVASLLLPVVASRSCERLEDPTCFTNWPAQPHNWTTYSLTNDSRNANDVRRRLDEWSPLEAIPSCWPYAAEFLCRLYKPECDQATGLARLPCHELCVATKQHCAVVEQLRSWPSFTDCSRFPTCANVVEVNGTTTNITCPYPLLATDETSHWYKDLNIKGCGIQCTNPLFTEKEHNNVRSFIAAMGSICLFCTSLALLTFLIDWKRQRQYPAVIIVYLNACFCVGSVGWLAQFINGARDKIVCHSDGTSRLGEPSGQLDATPCIIIFILIYYFLMATGVWFAILAMSWDSCFKSLMVPSEFMSGKTHWLHVIAWTLPGIKTVVILGMQEVDGDSLSGICFVGYRHLSLRAWFVFGPLGLYLTIGGIFLLRGLIRLCQLKSQALKFSSAKRVEVTVIRIGIFAFLAFFFSLVTFICHLHDYNQQPQWEKSLKDFTICQANYTLNSQFVNATDSSACVQSDRPSILVTIMQLFSMFGCGVAMSSWMLTPSAFRSWKHFLRRFRCRTRSSDDFHMERITDNGQPSLMHISRNKVAPATTPDSLKPRSSAASMTTDSGIQTDEGSMFLSTRHPNSVSSS